MTEPAEPGPGTYERKVLGADHPNYQIVYDAGLLLIVPSDAAPVPEPGCSSAPLAPTLGMLLLGLLLARRRRAAAKASAIHLD